MGVKNNKNLKKAIATGAVAKLHPTMRNKSISTGSKLRFMQAVRTSAAIFGCETCTLSLFESMYAQLYFTS